MRRYETIFVLRPDLSEEQLRQSIGRVEGVVANGGGELIETDQWGIRELAYHIKRERRGNYVRLDYVAPGATMNEVERNLKLMDEVLRHLSVLVAEEADAAALRDEVEARQRRIEEARAAAAAAAEARLAAEANPQGAAAPAAEAQGEPAAGAETASPAEPEAAPEEESAPAQVGEPDRGASEG